MSEHISFSFLNLFLVQGTRTTLPGESKDFLTTIVPALTALIGVVTGLIAAWKSQSDVYKDRLEQYTRSFDRNVESVKNAYDAEKRSLQLLLRQKESDIKNLKSRIKRLENFYSIHFTNIENKDDVLEKLILFLQYASRRFQDENFSQEVQKVEDYLKSNLGLVDRQKLRFEASDWLRTNFNTLVMAATEHTLNTSSENDRKDIEQSLRQYLKHLRLILNSGLGTEPDPEFIEEAKRECTAKYVNALTYIKDSQIGGQLSHDAYGEVEECIDSLVTIIEEI